MKNRFNFTQHPAMEAADLSAFSEATIRAESGDQLLLVVTMVTVRVLNKCHARKKRNQQEQDAYVKRLVNQVMEGLIAPQNDSPDVNKVKKVSKKVVRELQEKFCSRKKLESLIQQQDPAVDEAIVERVRAHIPELSEETFTRPVWKEVLRGAAIATGVLLCIIWSFA